MSGEPSGIGLANGSTSAASEGPGMRRETMIGGDDDVRAIERASRTQRVFDAADLGVDEGQRFARRRRADPLRVRGGVGIVEPHQRDIRVQLVEPDGQIGVDGAAILGAVGQWRVRGGGPSARGTCAPKFRRAREVVMNDRAGADRMVQQERRRRSFPSRRPAASFPRAAGFRRATAP